MRLWLVVVMATFCLLRVEAQRDGIVDLCPESVQLRGAEFSPGGIILTSFDASSLWVYDIDRATRYPLPETRPCTTNCRLSPDFSWLAYMNPQTYTFSLMRLDGTQRRNVLGGVSDVQWWSEDTWLVWTPDHRAYLLSTELEDERRYLPNRGLLSVQPGGMWGLALIERNGELVQALVNLASQEEMPVFLSGDTPYFNNARWSPDGTYLAYVGRGALDSEVGIAGSELYLIRGGDAVPRQLTFLSRAYGAVRINGYAPTHLSWSPDGTKIAFWVTKLIGANVEVNTGTAMIHVVDVNDGRMWRYCGFVTDNHTPNPSRLIWSPDGTHIAFAGDIPNDNKGYLLLALRVADGRITELSDGIHPALGNPDVVAWGFRP